MVKIKTLNFITTSHFEVEDESHFLMQCILYENRNELFMAADTGAPNFTNLNSQEQFIFLSQVVYQKT